MKYGHLELHIEELLKEKGISKNTICKELDIPRSNFNRYCRNEFQRLDAQLICKLCSYLECGIEELIEYARYVDNYYGTPRAYVEEQLEAGKDVILEIEIQGALKVKEKFPDTLLLFVTPPSAEELKSRLVGRGTETMDVIEFRMNRAKEEKLQISK